MNLFINVVFPVLLVFATGFALEKWKKLNVQALSTVALYVLVPCLVFRTIYEKELGLDYLQIFVFSLVFLCILIVIAKLTAKITHQSQTRESTFVLTTAFMNSGNYGAPIILFAFGQEGFAYAVMFFVLQSIIMNFFGVYYAARGRGGVISAVRGVLGMPATYVVVIALVMKWQHIRMPEQFYGIIDLLANAAIPLEMVILGVQLAKISVKHFRWAPISYGVMMRLVLSPVIAWGVLSFMPGVDPLLEKVIIVLCAMPTAVTATLYSVQFDSEPEVVSSVTLITTLVSMFSITGVLMLLT